MTKINIHEQAEKFHWRVWYTCMQTFTIVGSVML